MTALEACSADVAPAQSALACEVLHAPSDWPAMQLLLVTHPPDEERCEASGRTAARERVRALLLRHAGAAIAEPFLAAGRPLRGAGRVSISHERGVSMLAWCETGRVGVDIVDAQRIARIDPQELADVAALYFGAGCSASPSAAPLATPRRFAVAWAAHEARLKCLGRELEEWSPSLQAAIDGCENVAIALPPAHRGAARWTAQLAWRA